MPVKRQEPKSARDILATSDFLERFVNSAKYVSVEYQDFGLRLSTRLNDTAHKTLYIKIAKDIPRNLIEKAVSFTLDYPQAHSYGKIFMWKLVELCKEAGVKFSFKKGRRSKKQATAKESPKKRKATPASVGSVKSRKRRKTANSDQLDLMN